jgi:ubiquinone biosynthesis protein COQ4
VGLDSEFIVRHFGDRSGGAPPPRSLEIPPPPPPLPRQWRRAWRCLWELIDEPSSTEKVFELMEAFGGQGDEPCFQAFLAQPEGSGLLRDRADLASILANGRYLEALPDDSLGRHYLAFRRDNGLAAESLVEINHDTLKSDADLDPARRWFFDRLTAMHDLWHVVTGYGTDVVGEAGLLAFSASQIGSRPLAAIALAAAAVGPKANGFELQRFLLRAHGRGRRAGFLVAAPWEELLPTPLAHVRERLAVDEPLVAHPRGILRGEIDSSALERAPAL